MDDTTPIGTFMARFAQRSAVILDSWMQHYEQAVKESEKPFVPDSQEYQRFLNCAKRTAEIAKIADQLQSTQPEPYEKPEDLDELRRIFFQTDDEEEEEEKPNSSPARPDPVANRFALPPMPPSTSAEPTHFQLPRPISAAEILAEPPPVPSETRTTPQSKNPATPSTSNAKVSRRHPPFPPW